jgi:hypothetical protein
MKNLTRFSSLKKTRMNSRLCPRATGCCLPLNALFNLLFKISVEQKKTLENLVKKIRRGNANFAFRAIQRARPRKH